MIHAHMRAALTVALAGLLSAVAQEPAPSVSTAPANQPIPVKSLTLDRVLQIFQNAMIECEVTDQHIVIEENSMKVLITVDADKKVISYVSLWSLKEKAPMFNKLRMANTMNDETLMVRFAVSDKTTLWCDFQVPIERAVLPSEIVNWYRKFSEIVRWAVINKDPEDLIGTDEASAPAEEAAPESQE